jgi:hypothetical protein
MIERSNKPDEKSENLNGYLIDDFHQSTLIKRMLKKKENSRIFADRRCLAGFSASFFV